MSQMGRDGAERAAEYLGVVRGTWPLVMIAGAVALASALRQIRRGYRQRTLPQRAATVLLNAVMTTALAVACALLLPLFVPEVTPEVQIAASMALSGLGGETVKQWILGRLGLSVVDLMNADDIGSIREGMDPALRRKHLEQCPFRGDGVESDPFRGDGAESGPGAGGDGVRGLP